MDTVRLIAKLIYSFIPILWGVSLYVVRKHYKWEKLFYSLSVILFMYGFIDCISEGIGLCLTLLGIE